MQRFRYAPNGGTLVSTVLIIAAVPPVHWSPLIWVGLVPWLFGLRRCGSTREAVMQGFWLNVLLGFGGAFWVASAAQRYLGVSVAGGALVLIAHALAHQLQLVGFALVYWRVSKARPPATFLNALGLAFLYTGLDWLTPKLFGDSFGVVLVESARLRSLAAFGGPELLTFAIALANLATYALAAEALEVRRSTTRRPARLLRPLAWLVVPLTALVALGSLQQARIKAYVEEAPRALRVGIVQGNVPEELRRLWADGDAEAARESFEIYVRGTQRLFAGPDGPDLVVWPETAYPGIFRKPENDAQLQMNVAFDRAISSLGVPIAFGAYDREDRADRRVLRNAIYLVEPPREQPQDVLSPMQVYHKSVLFPIGEYVPLLDEADVRAWLPGAAHLSRGPGPKVLLLQLGAAEPLRVGPTICYEDVGGAHAVELAREGAEILLNVSNDTWFGDAGAAEWHLMMAQMRSVETGLPQIRATNSGYSAFILPTGDLYEVTSFGEEAAVVFGLPLTKIPPTVRTRLGDWFGPTSLVAALVWLLFAYGGVTRRLLRRSSR